MNYQYILEKFLGALELSAEEKARELKTLRDIIRRGILSELLRQLPATQRMEIEQKLLNESSPADMQQMVTTLRDFFPDRTIEKIIQSTTLRALKIYVQSRIQEADAKQLPLLMNAMKQLIQEQLLQ